MMFMSVPEMAAIIRRLLAKTRKEDGARWKPFAEEDSEYEHRTERFGYFIRSRDNDDAPPYVLEIYKYFVEDGQKSAVKVDEVNSAEHPDLFEPLSQLFVEARLSALGLRDVKDDILRDLE